MAQGTVIIPAYNEGARIGKVLSRIPAGYDSIVVDDGSQDDTAAIAAKYGARVIRLKRNKGKTAACLKGIAASRTDLCIFLDGDGQHSPEDIPLLVKELKHADMVIGKRDMGKVPVQRRISNWYARKVLQFLTGQRFPDALSGFRAVEKNAFSMLAFKKDGYFFESEMALQAAKKGLRIRFVPVQVSYAYGANMSASESIAVAAWLFMQCVRKMTGC